MILLEEELNYSKKQSRCRINALMREAEQGVSNSFTIAYTAVEMLYQWLYRAVKHRRRRSCPGNYLRYRWM